VVSEVFCFRKLLCKRRAVSFANLKDYLMFLSNSTCSWSMKPVCHVCIKSGLRDTISCTMNLKTVNISSGLYFRTPGVAVEMFKFLLN
jgi:hypothetical protein